MQTDGSKRFLSKKELAELLGISVFTVDCWVSQRRELPYVKAGRRVVFDLEDVLRWLEEKKIHPDQNCNE